MFNKIFRRFSKKSKEVLESDTVKNIGETIEDFTERTVEKAKDVLDDIKENESVKNVMAKAKETVDDIKSNEAVKNAMEKGKTAAGVVVTKSKEILEDVQQNEAVKNATDKIKSVINTGKEKVEDASTIDPDIENTDVMLDEEE